MSINFNFPKPYQSGTVSLTLSKFVYNPAYIVSTLAELNAAIAQAVAGDVVAIRGKIYQPTAQVTFSKSGTPSKYITYEAYPGEKVIFDGSLALLSGWEPPLIDVLGNFCILRNIEERNSPGGGIWAGYGGNASVGNDVIFDHVEAHHNRNGSGVIGYGDRPRFLYCSAHDNVDPEYQGQHADGLGFGDPAKRGASFPPPPYDFASIGAYFLGCISYRNSDDGFDVYGSYDSVFEKCVSYGNGLLASGNGQGFKLGPSGRNTVKKCIAYGNRSTGFGNEEETYENLLDHCTAFNNGLGDSKTGFIAAYPNNNTTIFRNNIGSFSTWQATPIEQSNVWNLGISDFGFASVDPASADFLSLLVNSLCRGRASDGGDLGALQYGERITDLLEI